MCYMCYVLCCILPSTLLTALFVYCDIQSDVINRMTSDHSPDNVKFPNDSLTFP